MAASGPVSRLPGSCKSNKTSRSLIDNKPGLGIFCFETSSVFPARQFYLSLTFLHKHHLITSD